MKEIKFVDNRNDEYKPVLTVEELETRCNDWIKYYGEDCYKLAHAQFTTLVATDCHTPLHTVMLVFEPMTDDEIDDWLATE